MASYYAMLQEVLHLLSFYIHNFEWIIYYNCTTHAMEANYSFFL